MAGLESYAREQVLEDLFNATNAIHVSLLSTLPVESVGEVEVSPAGYVRVSEDNWQTEALNEVEATIRSNVDNVIFGPYAEEVLVKGWAIYDALVAGNLLATGVFLNAGDNQIITITIPIGDDIQFQPGNLSIGLASNSGLCKLVCTPGAAGWSFPWSPIWGI